jgi:hypothetical protein
MKEKQITYLLFRCAFYRLSLLPTNDKINSSVGASDPKMAKPCKDPDLKQSRETCKGLTILKIFFATEFSPS